METYNFRGEDYDRNIKDGYEGKFVDKRNGIVCVGPTMDLECYYNYIVYLNAHRQEWKTYGYLDLGMIPIAMAPVINNFHNEITTAMLRFMRKLKVECYSMPSVSLMYEHSVLKENDLWVFREDLARIMGWDERQVSLERLLREVMGL